MWRSLCFFFFSKGQQSCWKSKTTKRLVLKYRWASLPAVIKTPAALLQTPFISPPAANDGDDSPNVCTASLQTYGLQQKNATVTEMCTFVCRVHEDSAAESAGLTAGEPQKHIYWLRPFGCPISCGISIFTQTHNRLPTIADPTLIFLFIPSSLFFRYHVSGDIIVTVNGVSLEGSSHQQVLELIRESANSLKWVSQLVVTMWWEHDTAQQGISWTEQNITIQL